MPVLGAVPPGRLHPEDAPRPPRPPPYGGLPPHTITSQEELFAELHTRDPGEPLLDLQEYVLGTVCAAVPIRTGTVSECVALSLPTLDPLKFAQAAASCATRRSLSCWPCSSVAVSRLRPSRRASPES
nr:IclR family transcriptional regulator C-terminal domain-containing protein [Streptomyces katrae]